MPFDMKYINTCVILCILMGGSVIHAELRENVRDENPSFNPALPHVMNAFLIQPAKSIEKQVHPKPKFHTATNVLDVARQNSATKLADFATNTSWLNATLQSGPGKVTLFAFSDEAYSRSSAAVKAALADVSGRNQILQYHVALGAHFSHDIAIRGVDSVVYSLYPSPPFKPTSQYQPIHVDSYVVDSEGERISVCTKSDYLAFTL